MHGSKLKSLGIDYVICIYLRLSSADDDLWYGKDESNSITNQRTLIWNFIRSQPEFAGCTVIEKCDDGISGTDFDRRPDFLDMIEMVKQGKIDCIIVKDFSRFGRDYVELGDYMEQFLPLLGIRFISINDDYDSDKLKDGDTGGLDVAFKNLVNDYYAREASKKRRLAWERSAAKGYYCAPFVMYGYRKSKKDRFRLEIDPETAPVVREIFDMKIAGMGTTYIARNLNDRGIPCPRELDRQRGDSRKWHNAERKCYWRPDVIEEIIRNEQYTGVVVNLKTKVNRVTKKQEKRPEEEWVKVENKHEAIINYATWLKAVSSLRQQEVRERKCRERKIYFCGCCGRQLRYPDKGRMHCYVRGYKTESECREVLLSKAEGDVILLNEIRAHLSRYLVPELLTEDVVKTEPEIPIEEQMQAVRKAIDASNRAWMLLYERYKDGSISREELVEQKAVHTLEVEQMQNRLKELEEKAVADSAEWQVVQERQAEATAFMDETELTEEMKERFIKKVLVYPNGRMQVEWNFGVDFGEELECQAS